MDFDRIRRRVSGTRPGSRPSHVLTAPSARSAFHWTPDLYVQAVREADAGSIARAADFCSEIMRDDRAGGVLEQRCDGMLALPGRFEPAELVPPDVLSCWPSVFPEAERAALLRWGVTLGIGFARVETFYVAGTGFVREIHTWHARHFDCDADGQWWVNATEGRRKVLPGEGWIVFTPYGRHAPTQRGLWHRLAVPVLAKMFAIDDRARSGEVTPILVGNTTGLTEPQRRTFLADLQGLARDSRVVLPEGCSLSVVDRQGAGHSAIHTETIEWADTAITITIAGQRVTTEGAPGFSAGGAQRAVLHSILRHQEETFSTCLGEQALTPWVRLVTGYQGPTIYPRHDVSDPEVLASKAYAITTLAPSIATMDQALAASGRRVDVTALLEQAGVPLLDLPKDDTAAERPTVALAPTDLVAVVSVNEARAAAGLGPLLLPDGKPDPAGAQSVALYRAALESAAVAPPGAPATPAGGAPTQAGDVAGALGGAAGATDEGPINDTAAEREAFAARMTEVGAKVCQHRRSSCERCGVERVATVDLDAATGQIVHPVQWRALPVRAALGLLAASAPAGAERLVACTALGDAPPDRFLIFRWGENETDRGTVIVDEEGIRKALARVGSRRLAIDLEHLSLDPRSPNYDPDARGSFVLAADAEGVWATDVRWTDDGAKRITERRQIYTSPAVRVDGKGRVIGVVNVALVAQPATHQIAPLIAASQAHHMDLEQLAAHLRLLAGLGPDASPDEIAAAITEKFTGAKAPEKAPEAPEGEPAGAELGTVAASATGTATGTAPAATGKPPVVDPGALALAKVEQLSATIAADRDARERDAVIAANPRKFSPALLAWARGKSAEEVRAFAAVAPDLTSEHLTAPAAPPADAITLSAAELADCQRFGTKPEVVLAIKRRNAAGKV